MISEVNEMRAYFKNKFGSTLNVPNGIYAIPTETSKGAAFMRAEIKDCELVGSENFKLFKDEGLKVSWYD